ncbi:MAG: C39 family peptidase [Patescibacteria group bacterium]
MKKGSATTYILIGVLLIAIGLIVAPILLIGTYLGGHLDKATGAFGPSGLGCFIADSAFTDTSIVAKQDSVIAQITAKWPAAKTNEKYVKEVFTRGEKEGINPLIPLAIWAGEQTFSHPEKAFGYGYKDSGIIAGVTNWDAQLNGVYNSIDDTINNTGNYTNPTDGNRFTRLFYNYTTAMKNAYSQAGNSWSENFPVVSARLAIFRLVNESSITCQQNTLLASATTGNDGVPLYKQANFPQKYGLGTIASSGCCTVSATMILNYYGINVDPVTISNLSYENGFYATKVNPDTGKVEGAGTNHLDFYPFLANKYGLRLENLGVNWDKALNSLKNGQPIIARGAGAEPYTTSGHCIVLTGYDSATGMVRVNNPASGDGPYPLNYLKQETTLLYLFSK